MDHAGHPTALVFNLKKGSPFSFKCQVCGVCCSNKAIRVGPYEALRLARSLGITTTRFFRMYGEEGGPDLRNKADGSCIFLGPRGCGVHPDRPLVCRLFPLGQLTDEHGAARFGVMPLHPDCLGLIDTDGTVRTYLESQGAMPYFRYDSLYSAIYKTIIRKRPGLKPAGEAPTHFPTGWRAGRRFGFSPGSLLARWSDVDAGLALCGGAKANKARGDLDDLVARHIQALEECVGRL